MEDCSNFAMVYKHFYCPQEKLKQTLNVVPRSTGNTNGETENSTLIYTSELIL